MTAPLVHALEAHYYTDPEIFRQERHGLLSQTWQFAGHRAQIPNKGDYFTFEIAGQSLFCVRGRDDQIRAFYNVCQHRAHELVDGTGTARLLVCPYHQWAYDLTGQLKAGPNVAKVPGLDVSQICLTEVRLEDFLGYLFINLDDDAAPMDDWYPGVRREIAEFVPHVQSLAPLEWVEIPENCNWKLSVENYSECYHCPSNHQTFATGVVKPETYDIQPDPGGGYVLRHVTECQSMERMTYPVDMTVPHAGDYQSWFLWPMFSFQCYPGNVLNTYHWRARDTDNCTVWRGWYSADGVEDEVIRGLAQQDRDTTVAEDIRLVESVSRGLRSRGYKPGPLVLDPACGVMSEHSIAKLHEWMRAAVAA
ncbi:MAG: aromatic ring-hydroxylating dioxygenase subunit alpha [Pseudomonadota bacterium]